MQRDINYLKSKFETGDVPTQDDFGDLLDSTYNLTGETISGGMSIPELNLVIKSYTTGSTSRRSEKLMVYWSSSDYNFLNYNPEVWLFRHTNRKKRVVYTGSEWVKVHNKKYSHPSHLNGIKYVDSNLYSGKISCFAPEIDLSGVSTEFSMSLSANTLFEIPIDPYDWFYMIGTGSTTGVTGTGYKLHDGLDFVADNYYLKAMGRNKGSWSFPFKLAITIDDPNGGQKRIYGQFSDVMFIRIINNKFSYRRNVISMSNLRFNMP